MGVDEFERKLAANKIRDACIGVQWVMVFHCRLGQCCVELAATFPWY